MPANGYQSSFRRKPVREGTYCWLELQIVRDRDLTGFLPDSSPFYRSLACLSTMNFAKISGWRASARPQGTIAGPTAQQLPNRIAREFLPEMLKLHRLADKRI